MARGACAAALCALVAGCASVGKDYLAPRLPAGLGGRTSTRFVAFDPALAAQRDLPDDWWRLYQDARLDALVAEALRTNTDLRTAAATLEATQAAGREVAAQAGVHTNIFTPQGGPAVSFGQTSSLGVAPSGGAHGQYDLAFGISYEVDVVGRIRRSLETAAANVDAQAAAYDLARISVVAKVVDAYTNVCAAGARLAVARRSVALQQRSLALTERGAQAGIYAPLDVARSQALLAQLQAVVSPLEGVRRSALYELAVLTGRAPADFPAGLANCSDIPQLAGPLPVGEGAALIRRRPDIREAERRLAAATAMVGVEIAGLYPTVSFGASLGSTVRMGADPLSKSAIHYSLGPVVSWTFPNRAVAHARIDQADASARAALARFDGTVLTALKEVDGALTAYTGDFEENRQLRLATDQSRIAARMKERLALGGTVSALEALDVERSLASAESALAASDARLASDRVRIFLALGGGWQTPPSAPLAAAKLDPRRAPAAP